jgi:hypothetical protein
MRVRTRDVVASARLLGHINAQLPSDFQRSSFTTETASSEYFRNEAGISMGGEDDDDDEGGLSNCILPKHVCVLFQLSCFLLAENVFIYS